MKGRAKPTRTSFLIAWVMMVASVCAPRIGMATDGARAAVEARPRRLPRVGARRLPPVISQSSKSQTDASPRAARNKEIGDNSAQPPSEPSAENASTHLPSLFGSESPSESFAESFAESPLESLAGPEPTPARTEYRLGRFREALDASHDGVPRSWMATLPQLSSELPELPYPSVENRVTAVATNESDDLEKRLSSNPRIDLTRTIPHPNHLDFSPTPVDPDSLFHDSGRESWVYDSKRNVPTQHPWVEWGRIFYGDGITPRGRNWFGSMNLVRPEFYVYGDFRSGVASGRNAIGRTDNWANRLNLDFDLKLTDTERLHAFIGPLDEQNRFTRWEVVDGDLRYRNEMDLTPVTGFFEGDLGVMLGSLVGDSSPFELPITAGLVPLLFQNGIWMEDAVTGLAFAIPAKHSRLLNWANFDATFFAVFDQINSPAFADRSDAQAFGTAWFIEAYGGYIESGYAYLNHRNDSSLSYHNATFSFTRRYFDRISNSVRVIVNSGQDRQLADRTADGGLFLFENSLITAAPLTVVPYANFFYGWNRPQSVARAGLSGGILRNTGINFDTDGLNGFATLDPTAADTAGGSIGIDLIGDSLDEQFLLELTYLNRHGDLALAKGDQYGTGARYQVAISNATLLRFDVMHGWRENEENVYGTRMEFRWKF